MERAMLLTFLVSCLFIFSQAQAPIWSVTDGSNVCILASFNANFMVAYNATNSTSGTTYTAFSSFNLSSDAKVDADRSYCSGGTVKPSQQILLQFGSSHHNISAQFVLKDNMTVLQEIVFEYDLSDSVTFPGATRGGERLQTARSRLGVMSVPVTTYFQCMSGVEVVLKNSAVNASTNVGFMELRLESFRNSSTSVFNGTVEQCPGDMTTVTVPTTTATTPTTPTTTATTPTTPTTSATTPTTESTTSAPVMTTWSVRNESTVCILAQVDANFTIQYNMSDAMNKTVLHSGYLVFPQDAKVVSARSYCDAGTVGVSQALTLSFGKYNHNMTVMFERDNMSRTEIKSITVEYDLNDAMTFPNATPSTANLQTAESMEVKLDIPSGNYFRCNSEVGPLMLVNARLNLTTELMARMIKLEAFRMTNTTVFNGTEMVCPADQVTTPLPPVTTTMLPPNTANYTVHFKENNTVCLLAVFEMSLSVLYFNKSGSVVNKTISDLNNGTVNQHISFCSENTSLLVIEDFLSTWSIEFQFDRVASKFQLTNILSKFVLNNTGAFPNANDTAPQMSNTAGLTKWSAKLGNSYRCMPWDNVKLNVTGNNAVQELDFFLQQVQVQAFMYNATGQNFGTPEDCANDYTSDVVPIAVGCALAALVVIVLIAYVIGRRRNRARGYESM